MEKKLQQQRNTHKTDVPTKHFIFNYNTFKLVTGFVYILIIEYYDVILKRFSSYSKCVFIFILLQEVLLDSIWWLKF